VYTRLIAGGLRERLGPVTPIRREVS
jgi:hypothetical protein